MHYISNRERFWHQSRKLNNIDKIRIFSEVTEYLSCFINRSWWLILGILKHLLGKGLINLILGILWWINVRLLVRWHILRLLLWFLIQLLLLISLFCHKFQHLLLRRWQLLVYTHIIHAAICLVNNSFFILWLTCLLTV